MKNCYFHYFCYLRSFGTLHSPSSDSKSALSFHGSFFSICLSLKIVLQANCWIPSAEYSISFQLLEIGTHHLTLAFHFTVYLQIIFWAEHCFHRTCLAKLYWQYFCYFPSVGPQCSYLNYLAHCHYYCYL